MLSTWGDLTPNLTPPHQHLLHYSGRRLGYPIGPTEDQADEAHSLLTSIPSVDGPVYENTRILQTLNTAEGDASRTDIEIQ